MAEAQPINKTVIRDLKSLTRLCASRKKNPWLQWAAHIYELLDELCPYLLLREPVIDAFHVFIDSLQKHRDEHCTYYYTKYSKYTDGIVLRPVLDGINKGRIYGMPSRWLIRNNIRENEISNDIYQNYLPLFELIKDDLVPATHQAEHKRQIAAEEHKWLKRIANINKSIIKLKTKYESDVERLNKDIIMIHAHIQQLKSK